MKLVKYGVLTFTGFILLLIVALYGRAAISEVAGLAVAQSGSQWNNAKDMAFGDGATNGVLYVSPCLWNGSSCDKQRGDTTNGAKVNVTAFAGAVTPSDTFTNPTNAINAFSLNGVWNGATWDRLKGDTTNGAYVQIKGSGTTAAPLVTRSEFLFNHISTNTNTQVKSGAGVLHGLSINTKGAAANVATVYDNTSCATTVIAIIDTTAGPSFYLYDLNFATGLCVTTATGTAADITVTYR